MATPPQRPGFPVRLDLGQGAKSVGGAVPRVGAGVVAQPRPNIPSPRPGAVPSSGTALPSQARDSIPARARMVQMLSAEGIRDVQVLRAMGAVDRHGFVDSALAAQAYEDTALPIGLGQTISRPSVVARMVELLMQGGLCGEDGRLGRVLDIGTGCGYQAVVLGQLAVEVYSIERLRDLHEKARANLRPLRVSNVHLILGDGMAGFAKGAPYAGIIAAAGGDAVPDAWVEQLAFGGRIVAPVSTAGGQQALIVIDKSRQGVQQTVLETVNFVPLKSGLA
ncbi:protein-L-isoaspartate(D-aspartate) O-methyltransferase [Ottowia sp.]|uniref:protein-L-isoaspartate(D-aspartate) O-methyltransferase n=1 Tax=Ottowia sp. TaxID=1898956 RepID=UPI003A897497